MTPSRSRRAELEAELLHTRHRRQRALRHRRRRRAVVVGLAGVAVLAGIAGLAGGAAVFAYGSSCDLDSLKPIDVGRNSFVYAANGSLLGAIPAERNRQPVAAKDMSPWIRKATVAVEDRRFFEHGGIDV